MAFRDSVDSSSTSDPETWNPTCKVTRRPESPAYSLRSPDGTPGGCTSEIPGLRVPLPTRRPGIPPVKPPGDPSNYTGFSGLRVGLRVGLQVALQVGFRVAGSEVEPGDPESHLYSHSESHPETRVNTLGFRVSGWISG